MIYLDANATSALRPEARSAHEEVWSEVHPVRNPSSIHAPGRKARSMLTAARGDVLALLAGGAPLAAQLVFTSGGTESCNSIIRGFLGNAVNGHLLSSSIEHAAVLRPLEVYARAGMELELADPEADGILDPEKFASRVRADTALVCVMLANNETGAIQPVAEIARALRGKNYSGPIFSDVSQAIGKSELALGALFDAGVSAVAFSAHKFGAPTGVGATVLNTALCHPFEPLIAGGAQQGGLRSGTENVAGICALGAVCHYLQRALPAELRKIHAFRELLWRRIAERVTRAVRLTPEDLPGVTRALPNTLFVHTPGIRGDDLVVALDLRGVAASAGSACASGKQQTPHVLTALGYSAAQAREAVRLSIDWNASEEEMLRASEIFADVCEMMRTAKLPGEGASL